MSLSFRQVVVLGTFIVIFLTLSLGLILWGKQAVKNAHLNQIKIMSYQSNILAKDMEIYNWENFLLQYQGSLGGNFFSPYKLKNWAEKFNCRLTIIASDGHVIADSTVDEKHWSNLENYLHRPEIKVALENFAKEGFYKRYSVIGMQDYLFYVKQVKTSNGEDIFLRLGKPIKEIEALKWVIFQHYIFAILFGFVLSIILSFIIRSYVVKPLKLVTQAVKKISHGNLDSRVMHYPNNELAELGRAFDKMAERLAIQMDLLERSRDYLVTVLSATTEGIMVTNKQGKIMLVNQAFKSFFNIEANIEGLTPAEAVRVPTLIDALEKALDGQKVTAVLERVGDLRDKTLEVSLSLINFGLDPTDSKKFSHQGLVGIFYDVTSRQQIYKMRRSFVANISRDLKKPLVSILDAIVHLKEMLFSESELNFLNIVEYQSERLKQMSEGLLRLARLEAEYNQLDLSSFLVSNLLVIVKERFNKPSGINLVVHNLTADLIINADFEALALALINLLDNAVKYGPLKQEIILEAKIESDSLFLRVVDQGPGIPILEQERVFERFYRLEKNRENQNEEGAGLGLAIVKHTAKCHHGDVNLKSSSFGGAVFEIVIPLEKL